MNGRLERFRTGPARYVLAAVAVLLITSPWWLAPTVQRPGSVLHRLLGPFAPAVARVQWVRAHVAWSRGRHAEGHALAASVLELAPEDPDSWIGLARQYFHSRGSTEREPDPEARAEWMRAALELCRRGSDATGGHPALDVERGVLLVHLAKLSNDAGPVEGEFAWPGRPSDLLEAAARAFEAAAKHGDAESAEVARGARESAEEARAAGR